MMPSEDASLAPAQHPQALIEGIRLLVASTLGLPETAVPPSRHVRMLGAMPELDSMSVVTLLVSLEEQYGIVIHDDEIDAHVFETLGSLVDFVHERIA